MTYRFQQVYVMKEDSYLDAMTLSFVLIICLSLFFTLPAYVTLSTSLSLSFSLSDYLPLPNIMSSFLLIIYRINSHYVNFPSLISLEFTHFHPLILFTSLFHYICLSPSFLSAHLILSDYIVPLSLCLNLSLSFFV